METNKEIYRQLLTHAQRYFTVLDLAPGTYSLSALAKSEMKGDGHNETVTVEAGSFKCTLTLGCVFAYLLQFEKLAKIPKAQQAEFVKEKDIEGEIICEFDIELTKEHRKLAAYASKDAVRPAFMGINVNVTKSQIEATDTHILGVMSANIANVSGNASEVRMRIHPKELKSALGIYHVTYYRDASGDRHYKAKNTETGHLFTDEEADASLKYPDTARVYPTPTGYGNIHFTKEAVKLMTKATAKIKEPKHYGCGHDQFLFRMEFEIGSDVCLVSVRNPIYDDENNYTDEKQIAAKLKAPAHFSGAISFDASNAAKMLKSFDGAMNIIDASRPTIFGLGPDRGIIMPTDDTRNSGMFEIESGYETTPTQPHTETPPETVDLPALGTLVEFMELAARLIAVADMAAKAAEIERIADAAQIDLTPPATPAPDAPQSEETPPDAIPHADVTPIPQMHVESPKIAIVDGYVFIARERHRSADMEPQRECFTDISTGTIPEPTSEAHTTGTVPPALVAEAIHNAPEQPPELPPPEHREKSPPH